VVAVSKARRRTPSASVRARFAAVFAVVATLFVVYGARVAHVVLRPHGLCEHGEFVHADGSVGAEAPIAGDHDEDGRDRLGASGGVVEAEHEHCEAVAVHHQPAWVASYVAEASLLTFSLRVECEPAFAARPIEVLWLAPKASPPRVSVVA